MPSLNADQKVFIVHALACFDTPSQVVEALKEEFNLTLDRANVQAYDPTKVQGRALGKKHVDIFWATREKFLEETGKIPIAAKSFRLRALQSMYDSARSRKNFVLAKEILEQAAKEVGDFYTNKHTMVGDPDNPLMMFMKQISETSLPVVHEEKEVKAVVQPKRKPRMIEMQKD